MVTGFRLHVAGFRLQGSGELTSHFSRFTINSGIRFSTFIHYSLITSHQITKSRDQRKPVAAVSNPKP